MKVVVSLHRVSSVANRVVNVVFGKRNVVGRYGFMLMSDMVINHTAVDGVLSQKFISKVLWM